MKKYFKSLAFPIAILGMVISSLVYSGDEDKNESGVSSMIEENILKGLRGARPDLAFGKPTKSPVPGYYQVTISGAQTIYVSESGDHFFSGELYFAEPGRFVNATEMARTEKRLAVLAELKEEDMIVFEPINETKATMTVFTDVTCGYCRKLHQEVGELNDLGIKVRYMAFPRSGIKRNGTYTREYMETVKAWCADDRQMAMTAIKGGQNLDIDICEGNPVPEQFKVGSEFGVTGTPAIILPDGSLLPGYRSPSEYAAVLGL